jgi:uncharacterized protein
MKPKETGLPPTQSPYVRVQRSVIHGQGVYARMSIPSETRIIEYVGERVTKKESDRRGELPLTNNAGNAELGAVYLFELNKRYDIDGYVDYNTARCINHSCDPNCEAKNIRGHIWVIAKRDIVVGEELTYNYNYAWDAGYDHPCWCGSYKCVGHILDEDFWPKLFRRLRKETIPVPPKEWIKMKRQFILD